MTQSAATGTTVASFDDVPDAIEVDVNEGTRPFEVGSHRGSVPCDEIRVLTKEVQVEYDAGDEIHSTWDITKAVRVRDREYDVRILLVLSTAAASDDGKSVLVNYTVRLVPPFDYHCQVRMVVPPVVLGPGGDYAAAPYGRMVEVVA